MLLASSVPEQRPSTDPQFSKIRSPSPFSFDSLYLGGIALDTPYSTGLKSQSVPRRTPSPFDFNSLPTAPAESAYFCRPPSPFDFEAMADVAESALVSVCLV